MINTEPENYLFNRGLSLWTTINFQLFARRKGMASVMLNHGLIATLCGEVNRRYAEGFMARTRSHEALPVL
ncbi:MAG: hypothetical protein H7343_03215 [Undibacterium sp.]|nr:hypothetical protein [Opitutaceae bacterium]